ncbi:MAG: YlxR family protein [Bacilli bacterium]|nr:YlxR family protein [Bacilli bacterium]
MIYLKKRKIPLRKCLITNEQYPKQEMIRIVINKDNEVSVDTTGKKNGRGAYLKLTPENLELALKKRLFEKTFNVKNIDYIYQELADIINE